MNQETTEKLAASLTAESTELLPFLPYLLQDLWELGSSPDHMSRLIQAHISQPETIRVLDLACGKGAVSVRIAKDIKASVKGVDAIPAFIEFAQKKAEEFGTSDLCKFVVGDVNQAVCEEKDYDCVIFGAAGNILGSPAQMLVKLKSTIKPAGYVLLDEAYLMDNIQNADVKYQNYAYLTHDQWLDLFAASGFRLIDAIVADEEFDSEPELAAMTRRADELSALHPDKQALFESYIRSQKDEYDDLSNAVIGVTWLLQATA